MSQFVTLEKTLCGKLCDSGLRQSDFNSFNALMILRMPGPAPFLSFCPGSLAEGPSVNFARDSLGKFVQKSDGFRNLVRRDLLSDKLLKFSGSDRVSHGNVSPDDFTKLIVGNPHAPAFSREFDSGLSQVAGECMRNHFEKKTMYGGKFTQCGVVLSQNSDDFISN